MTAAQAGNAVKLQIGNGGTGETFDDIAEVLDIDGPNQTRDSIEVTSHDSGGWREFIGGLRDGGEVSFSVNLIPGESTQWDDQYGLLGLFDSGISHSYRLFFPNGYNGLFEATVTDFGVKSPVDGVVSGDIKLKISGEVIWDSHT